MTYKNQMNLSKIRFYNDTIRDRILNLPLLVSLFIIIFSTIFYEANAQVVNARRTGFTWITTKKVKDVSFGAGYTMYSAAWPIFKDYPGASNFQTGLGSSWLTTQRTGNEPAKFYTTIEGGLGWWMDTRFGTKHPKFIMGGVSHNFFAWANGPGAGKSSMLRNGQRDWSTPGGKYGIAQLSNRLLWAPDGLNMAQSLNGELLGYGYTPLPLTDPMAQTAGVNIETGNQCWTLFMNSTNFKGPAAFFLPTFWTKPVLANPALEGLFFDTRPSNPNVGLGVEQALFPAIISSDNSGTRYAKIERIQFPISDENNSIIMNQVTAYSQNALWNDMETWFNGGAIVQPGMNQTGVIDVSFSNNGGSMSGEISESRQNGLDHPIDLTYINNVQQTTNTMGFEYDLNTVDKNNGNFILPEYFRLDPDNKWRPIDATNVPASTNLIATDIPASPRSEITYLTPLESDCHWQDPNGPWNNPGPSAGPFTADLGDGTTVTYYWYRFIDQPAIINANLPTSMRTAMQARVELIHSNWNHTDEYLAPPSAGNLATIDPNVIIQPPAGFEIGYVPIVTRQQKTPSKVRVFILAGQSNMQGQGTVVDPENDPGDLIDVIQNDTSGDWSVIGQDNNWTTLNNVHLYYEGHQGTIREKVTVGQGANSNSIGPELMFAHQLDEYYDDPILIIKTAWGGKSLAEDFRPPSAVGKTGPFYNKMIQIIQHVTQNLSTEFPNIGTNDFEISGFAWFQGWNDGKNNDFLNEYESNLNHLINDVRTDLAIPDLPIVVASSGHGGYFLSYDHWVQGIQNIISVAQEKVACDDVTYGGHIGFVDTKQFYLNASISPYNGVFHFNNNALTFLNIGNSIGKEMILAINEMAFCNDDCGEGQQILPKVVSIGNRVWNDLNRDGINDPNEPGIPGVSVLLWSDSDGDNIPDWQGFEGVKITDADGYYRFSDLQPGNYVAFVWSLNNWGVGEPLNGFVSSNGFVANANNDTDLDNNGSGKPFTDIMSGIVTLTIDGEPLNDGDPFNCFFDFDSSGNNTIDFGFFDPNATLVIKDVHENRIQIFPNPVLNELTIKSNSNLYQIKIFDLLGQIHRTINPTKATEKINLSTLPKGLYLIKLIDEMNNFLKVQRIIKQ
ncbi:putative secreted protein (Por secretion system target) [Aquimarina sp. MAR_2010_214]|uniref:sialate O-acetylesterase n=1 Tax=Aquimarina sp. MAR_2010_214 TaxID=1250026 RepID=UPI000C6FEAC8|nr:sialate O-acetylesterase [Aquimarina sp. MAR_2010_214]PKV50910.1 putative secreted protein (Por secretion system target) [Aquimarina sp. MAR_2010_214]